MIAGKVHHEKGVLVVLTQESDVGLTADGDLDFWWACHPLGRDSLRSASLNYKLRLNPSRSARVHRQVESFPLTIGDVVR